MITIPESLQSNVPRSEVIVFNAFKQSVHKGVLLHSLSIPRSQRNHERELDFVLIHESGIFVIEVKGGQISFTNGKWYSTDFREVKHEIKDPFKQAQSAAHILHKKIIENFAKMDRVLVESIVCTPDNLNAINTFEYPESKMLCARDFYDQNTFDEKLASMLKRYQGLYIKQKITPRQVDRVKEYLRPNFEGKIDIRNATLLVNHRLIELSDRQNEIFKQFSENSRILVNGVAGTGKTVLALAKLNERLSHKNPGSTLFLCYNRLLADELKSRFPKSKLLVHRAKISTVDAHILEGLYRYANTNSSFKEKINLIQSENIDPIDKQQKLASLYGDIPSKFIDRYDYLIIDEAQDILTNQDYFDVASMSLVKGIKNGQWSMFADTHQNIFRKDHRSLRYILEANNITCVTWSLQQNMRSTNQIISVIKDYSDIKCKASGIDGPDVRIVDGEGENISVLRFELSRLINMGVWPSHISLIATRSSHLKLFQYVTIDDIPVEPYEASTRRNLAADQNKSLGAIKFTSVRRFKGLENDVVVLTIDKGRLSENSTYLKMLYYIGITRARFMLVLIPIN